MEIKILSFDHVEIISRTSKKILHIKKIKSLEQIIKKTNYIRFKKN